MTWLILTVVLGIIGIAGVVWAMYSPQGRGSGVVVAGIAFLVWVVLTIFMSISTVGQREVGLVQSFSGSISNNYKTTGVATHAPWTHIIKEDIGLLKDTFTFAGDNSAVSKDQQQVDAVVTLNYRLAPNDVVSLYKTVGPKWRTVLLDGRVPQDFKETTALFTAPDITLQRPELRKQTLARLKRELCPHGPSGEFCIGAEDVFISNVSYSKAYNDAIEAKVVQQQAAQTAQAKVVQATAEADQAVATAKGERDSAIARAEGDAKSIELTGRALKNNPEVIKYQALQKLAAQAQVIFCTDNNCPSILGSLGTGK